MAVLALGVAGKAIGGAIGGTVLGVSAAAIGGFVGAQLGGVIDRAVFGQDGPDPRHTQGPRINDLTVTSAALGRPIPKLWGTMICGSNIIQSSQLVEHSNIETFAIPSKKKGSKKGPGPDTAETFFYTLTFAVGFCKGEAEAILRMWAGNELIYDVTGTGPVSAMGGAIRTYLGTEDQLPDPALEALVGADNALAYRGWVYAVFDTVSATGQPPLITAEIAMVSTGSSPNATIDTAANLSTSVLFGNIVAGVTKNSLDSTLYALDTIGLTEIHSVDLDAGALDENDAVYSIRPIADGALPIDFSGNVYMKRPEHLGTTSFWRYEALTGKLNGRTALTLIAAPLTHTGDFSYPAVGVRDGVIIGRFGEQKLVVVGNASGGTGCLVATYDVSIATTTVVAVGVSLLPQIAANDISNFLSVTLTPTECCLAGDADGNIWLLAAGSDGNGYLVRIDPIACIPLETFTITGRKDLQGLVYYENENALLFFDDLNPGAGIFDLIKWDIDTEAITATLRMPAALDLEKSANVLRQSVINHRIWVTTLHTTHYQIDVSGDMALARTVTFNVDATGTQIPLYDPIQNALVVNDYPDGTFDHVHLLYLDRETGGTATLKQIVEDIHTEVGHTAGDHVDASALSGVTVRGYALTSRQPAVGGIKALIPAFQFDARESDWQAEYVLRGGDVVVTIPAEDLAARSDLNSDTPEIEETRGQEIELPERIDVTYPSAERDYETGDQHARRVRETLTTRAQITIDLPVKLSDTEAKAAVERLLDLVWIARDRYAIALTWEYVRIDAAEAIRVTLSDGTTRDIFVQQVNQGTDGVIHIEGTRNDPVVFDFDYTGASGLGFVESAVRFAGPSALYVMDIPLVRDADDGLGMYVAGGSYGGTSWPGAAVIRSTDGTNWSSYTLLPSSKEATHGVASTALANPTAWTTWDRTSTLTVRMFNGTLSSATELAVLNGANMMLVGDEIIQFASATLNADGSYTLSTLLRGRRGTEWAVDDHVANEAAVVISGPQHVTMDSSTLNVTAQYAAVTVGATIAGSLKRTVRFTGASQKPYSPCQIEGVNAGSPADWTITWERRTRIGGAWSDLVDVPLGEETEKYEIDILSANGAGGDSLWDDVVLLVDAATNADDLSDLDATATLGSQAAVSGGQIVFSPSGSADPSEAYVEYIDRADYTIGTQAFCIEVDATFDDLTATLQIIASHYTNTGNQRAWNIERNGNNLDFNYSSNGSSASNLSGAFTFVTGSKYRLCVERDASNVLRIYVNGAEVASAAAVTTSIFNSTAPIRLGKYRSAGFTDLPLFGKVDNFRMTIGASRYGGAYTPPARFPTRDVGEVIRTITATPVDGGSYIDPATRTAVYTQVDQISDFGSPPSSIDIKAYQLSALVGRGFAREATLSL